MSADVVDIEELRRQRMIRWLKDTPCRRHEVQVLYCERIKISKEAMAILWGSSEPRHGMKLVKP